MAALASSAVSFYPTTQASDTYLGRDSSVVKRRLKLVLTGQGGQTNSIGAAALGFSQLIDCSNLFDDENNKVYPAVVDPVANTIILADGSAAPAPVDVTASAAYIVVTGNPKMAQ